ncbi:MAG: hypothetical protein HPY50_09225 [Firmicutes bacterium]|nr:hypothetical protein [Bacillota bacterium]
MPALDKEELFLALRNPPSSISAEERRVLSDSGYIGPDGESTERGREIVDSYIGERAEVVYRALTSSVDDFEAYYRLRDEGWFRRHPAFLAVVRHLGDQGRILKKN